MEGGRAALDAGLKTGSGDGRAHDEVVVAADLHEQDQRRDALGMGGGEGVVEAAGERVDALLLERRGDVVEVDAGAAVTVWTWGEKVPDLFETFPSNVRAAHVRTAGRAPVAMTAFLKRSLSV